MLPGKLNFMMSSAEQIAGIKTIRVGHSPDPDDAFMFYAIAKGKVNFPGLAIEHVIEDIQSLNRRALNAELEMTAISAAVYPLIAKDYWILSTGASVGRNYGPIVVAKTSLSLDDLRGKRIGVPGLHTTAFLLLKIFIDDFVPVELHFTDIIGAVREGRVDAGLVIHEGQLNYASFGVLKCLDLGVRWFEKTGLPIPLGLDVIRKDLGRDAAREINSTLAKSIQYAQDHQSEAIPYALEFGRGIPGDTAERFVKMYVNEDTLDLGEEGAEALRELYKEGALKGIFEFPSGISVIR